MNTVNLVVARLNGFSIRSLQSVLLVSGFLLFASYLILRNAWVCDDAFIAFRSVDQLFAGNGLHWNPHERVQSFTSPLWIVCLSLFRIFTSHLYFISVGLGAFFSLASIYLLFVASRISAISVLLVLALLFSSHAWYDFTTSGLENSLEGFLILVFLTLYTRKSDIQTASSMPIFFVGSLILLTRLDALTLLFPSLARESWLLIRARNIRPALLLLVKSFSLLIAWEVFSLFYYGVPLPNTAYAKLFMSLPRSQLLIQGYHYFYSTLVNDPVTLIVITIAIIMSLRRPEKRWKSVGIGILLNSAYVGYVGGDFMQGRFFTSAYVASVYTVIVLIGPRLTVTLSAGLCLSLICCNPFYNPLSASTSFKYHGIINEKVYYWQLYSLKSCLYRLRKGEKCLLDWCNFESIDCQGVRVGYCTGCTAYSDRTSRHWVDLFGLSDPLFARLPVRGGEAYRPGHGVPLYIPVDYILSAGRNDSVIRDPDLKIYHSVLQAIMVGPLWDGERLKQIVKFNLGGYDHHLRAYISRSKHVISEHETLLPTIQERCARFPAN